MLNVNKIPPEIGYYLTGFADGEGSFNVSFRKRDDYKFPWKISLCFNISQKDPVILSFFKKHLQCGTMRQRKDGVWYYEVNNFNAIRENIIPFFNRYKFLSAKKKRDFSKFKQIFNMMLNEDHLTSDGIKEIVKLRNQMNDGGKRKYSDEEIMRILRDHMPNTRSKSSKDMVRTSWKHEDLSRNSLDTDKISSNKK